MLTLHGLHDIGWDEPPSWPSTITVNEARVSTGSSMNEFPTYAIIPTNGRPCFKECLAAAIDQVDRVYVVEGGPDALFVDSGSDDYDITVVREPELNISRWWNLGLSLIADRMREHEQSRWNVVILNDDAMIPPGWVDAVSTAMRSAGAAAGCSGNPNPWPVVHQNPGPVDLSTRLQGYAFILAGEKGVRANEQLKWYFSDDHVDWMSRQHGGVINIPGFHVRHLYPNGQLTAELQVQIAEDAKAFTAYWAGMRPW